METRGPLQGIKVLDLTQAMAGPMATMTLGDLGAEIIKVEPLTGDQTRAWAPPYMDKMSSYYLSANRNKKSIAIDLKGYDGQEILKKLVLKSDVLIENFRPGTMQKFGLQYEEARKLNSRMIYCSLSGYGQTGPSSEWPGYDLTVLSYSGLLSLNAEEERPPIKFGVPIADITAGLFSDIAILAALHHRDSTGEGQFIDMSMLDANFSILTHQAMGYLSTGKNPRHLGSAHSNIAPYQVFQTADGYIAMAVGTEKLWKMLCRIIGREDLTKNPLFLTNVERVKNREKLAGEINRTFSAFKTQDLFQLLLNSGIPAAPINTVEQVMKAPQIRDRKMLVEMEAPYGRITTLGTPFKLSSTPGSVRLHPPMLGENTSEILHDLGYTDDEIADLMNRDAVNRDVNRDMKEG
ncbi:CaiB/BaiF CoA-transferase family protein [Oxyplasma meridianum]|uniref:CaiB/BaiF CoA-transferase family protein n=1 Tax=Oxyplasma meridianum TaxID=3073602 RepID=A0AAX4NHT4_9ARCH